MKLRFSCLAFCAMLLITALNCFAVDVKADFDHHVNFSQYKTYSWGKVDTPDPLWNDRVKEAVDRQLAAKGLQQVPTGGDITVVAVGLTHEKPTLETFYNGFDGLDVGWLCRRNHVCRTLYRRHACNRHV